MLRVLLFVIPIVIAIYSLVDCVQSSEHEVRGLPKIVWVFIILLFPLVGSAGWWIAGRPAAVPPRPPRLPGPPRSGPPSRPRGPDDDPDFLRSL